MQLPPWRSVKTPGPHLYRKAIPPNIAACHGCGDGGSPDPVAGARFPVASLRQFLFSSFAVSLPYSGSPCFQLLFRIQRQFDHALEQLLRGNTREVLQYQLLHIEAYEITQLQRAISRCEYKVT